MLPDDTWDAALEVKPAEASELTSKRGAFLDALNVEIDWERIIPIEIVINWAV
jgi:hypothetical protein